MTHYHRISPTYEAVKYELGKGLEDGAIPSYRCGAYLAYKAWLKHGIELPDRNVPFIESGKSNKKPTLLRPDSIILTDIVTGERSVITQEDFEQNFRKAEDQGDPTMTGTLSDKCIHCEELRMPGQGQNFCDELCEAEWLEDNERDIKALKDAVKILQEKNEALVEALEFDITQFPAAEEKVIALSISLGVDAVHLLEACDELCREFRREALALLSAEALEVAS